MDLLAEYINQSTWRNWERYLEKLPLDKKQIVYDLGCSIGTVTNLLAKGVQEVIGFDNDSTLLEEANNKKETNCRFVLDNIFTLDPNKLVKCDGIWMSFALAYMEDPLLFISKWTKCLNDNGWFAIVDIDGMLSGNLPVNNKFKDKVASFEQNSGESKLYDFRIGRKIKPLLEECGLEVIISEENWYDVELNFNGSAEQDILKNWRARLERMVTLKDFFGADYPEFCMDFLNHISHENHTSNGCVKFYVGIKRV